MDLPSSYSPAVRNHVPELAQRIDAVHHAIGRPAIIGINGAQGSGKSTLALFLAEWLDRETGLGCARLSLDDVYLDRAERRALAAGVHPLLATRGVPGTHDVALAHDLLDTLTDTSSHRTVHLPIFDKALDDRAPQSEWPSVQGPVDVVLFEGWCVGARPQSPDRLTRPVNELEAREDSDGSWRRYVNWRLETDYAELFARLNALVMLRVPDFDKVFAWRRLQEQKLRERRGHGQLDRSQDRTYTDEQLRRFIMHYERLTRHMLTTVPGFADSIIDIDENHRLLGRTDPGWKATDGARP
jgi:D-glycerate 3-kinase